jgi:hypothetical protein
MESTGNAPVSRENKFDPDFFQGVSSPFHILTKLYVSPADLSSWKTILIYCRYGTTINQNTSNASSLPFASICAA